MSTFIQEENVERPTRLRKRYGVAGAQHPMLKPLQATLTLFDDLEDRPLAVARGGTREQSANSLNGLAAAAYDAANVASSKLQLKDGCSAVWNFRQHHVVRKFNQLADDELEKLSHALEE